MGSRSIGSNNSSSCQVQMPSEERDESFKLNFREEDQSTNDDRVTTLSIEPCLDVAVEPWNWFICLIELLLQSISGRSAKSRKNAV